MIQDRLKTVAFAAVAAATALWVGCTDTLSEQETLKKSGQVRITLSAESSRQVEVKSIDDVDENSLADLWVIQIGSDGNVIGTPDYNNLGTGSNDDFVAGANGTYTVNVQVDENTAKICFIANTGNNTIFQDCTTLAQIRERSRTVSSEASLINSNNYTVVMSGVWNSTDSDFTVEMYRAIAKVDFTLTTGTGVEFALHSVQVYNVPTHLYYYREPDEFETPGNITSTYPATGFGFMNYPETTYGSDHPLTSLEGWDNLLWLTGTSDQTGEIINSENEFTYTWYLPENARGTGSATDQRNKCAETARAGEGEYCTYIKINGFYKSDNLVTKVSYDIYLGENNYNDYNVLRNSNYEVTTTILGLDRIDTRINTFDPTNYYDYTDNSSPWFAVAASTEGTFAWDASFPSTRFPGWEYAEKEDLMLIWIYLSTAENITGTSWAGKEKLTNNVDGTPDFGKPYRWYINLENGLCKTFVQQKEGETTNQYSYWTIKRTPKGFIYPYVEGGANASNIIVSRDEYGGVDTKYLRTGQWTDDSHNETEALNRVPAKLEVASREIMEKTAIGSDGTYRATWENAKNECTKLGNGWRMPTQRELMLIYIMNDQLNYGLRTDKIDGDTPGVTGNHTYYWSSTESSSDKDGTPGNQTGWSICFCQDDPTIAGKVEQYTKTANNYIRCVRDVKD